MQSNHAEVFDPVPSRRHRLITGKVVRCSGGASAWMGMLDRNLYEFFVWESTIGPLGSSRGGGGISRDMRNVDSEGGIGFIVGASIDIFELGVQ